MLVIGLARSGAAAASFLAARGAKVVATDVSDSDNIISAVKELEDIGVTCVIGQPQASDLDDVDFVIVSPGVDDDSLLVAEAMRLGVPVLSEVELAGLFVKVPVVAVTGTNGKTTTTTLIDKMLKTAGIKSIAAGNIGYPMIKAVEDIDDEGVIVAEISSFQLDHIDKFHPKVALMLNITEDHLDRHKTFSGYIKSKSKVFVNQQPQDYAIINYDDESAMISAGDTLAKRLHISKTKKVQGAYLDGDWLVLSIDDATNICRRQDLKIIGEHNIDNALGAAAASACMGADVASIREVLLDFTGLPHRLKMVGEIDGVAYYNDSKATNPDATVKALTAFSQPVILLAGGKNKGYRFDDLAGACQGVKHTILFGDAAIDMAEDFSRYGLGYDICDGLEDAFAMALKIASRGDVVLLSPACASFDQYENYQKRGEHFERLVMGVMHAGD